LYIRGIQTTVRHGFAVKQIPYCDFYMNGREPANNNDCGPVQQKKGWTPLMDIVFIYITNCEVELAVTIKNCSPN